MFNDLFEDIFAFGFGRPTRLIFNTNGLKDMNPFFWSKTDDGYKATVKTLGIENVRVDTYEYGITISGENEIDGKKYDTTLELPICPDVLDNVIEITHQTKCGITIINLITSKPDKKKIKITKR